MKLLPVSMYSLRHEIIHNLLGLAASTEKTSSCNDVVTADVELDFFFAHLASMSI